MSKKTTYVFSKTDLQKEGSLIKKFFGSKHKKNKDYTVSYVYNFLTRMLKKELQILPFEKRTEFWKNEIVELCSCIEQIETVYKTTKK